MSSKVQDSDVDVHGIIGRLDRAYFNNHNYFEAYERWVSIFGMPTIFSRIDSKVRHERELTCPHCGMKGLLMAKTTVSKKKYRYMKLYIYHETKGALKASSRAQKWCYLNIEDKKSSAVREAIQRTVHALNVRGYFYRSLILP